MKAIEITEEQEQAIIAFYLEPNSISDVEAKFGISRHRFINILSKNGVEKHSKEITKYLNKRNGIRGSLAKYGVENPMQHPDIASKTSASLRAKTEEEKAIILAKHKNTKQLKYGDENFNNRAKAALTLGASAPAKLPAVQDKMRKTNLKKYGVENVFQADEIKTKLMSTCLERYGNEHYTKTDDYLRKTTQTCQSKYSTNFYCQSEAYAKTAHKKYNYNDLIFDSSWELALWIYAKDHDEKIERIPVRLEFELNGDTHYCLPDFEYKGKLIEIKGAQFIKNGKFICPYDESKNELFEAKQNCLIEHNVQIWTKHNIQFALDYVKNTYGKSYLKQFKTKVSVV